MLEMKKLILLLSMIMLVQIIPAMEKGLVTIELIPNDSLEVQIVAIASSMIVDWGDGTISEYDVSEVPKEWQLSHVYQEEGVRTVCIKADSLTCFGYDGRYKIVEIDSHFEEYWNSLSFGYCPDLDFIGCSRKELERLDVKQCPNLKTLECYYNGLKELDVSKNKKLRKLKCSTNQLQTLDLSRNAELEMLDCNGNRLSELKTTANAQLWFIYCGMNEIKSLNVRRNHNLRILICIENQLTSLDIRKNTKLEELYCDSNRISSIKIGKNTELKEISINFNNMSYYNLGYLFNNLSMFRDGTMRIFGNPGSDKLERSIIDNDVLGWKIVNEKLDINDINMFKVYYLMFMM